ncbi:E3 ubiquitin-protein ligase listerin [Acyrthosiphon pisum]|uniref:E3 ubiquitin-protein ligase listerin n=1 Tax=Acyrthosiphon pisum TaxID=7029 RepID=A0A8R2AE36_ACYPI|nr:E3 ubiquitin-protein ligase listerin [Acyrthosiphon pisum]|eukprot:XP_001950973.1 PREDICTED: E3 ubiquitin-protein ligase listerin [Acyrthosiphon pisum]
MGKKQVAQRVKNNYKPSSSARAQLLLSTTDTYGVIPDKLKFPFADILDCNVSPDFQVVLKKMNKKDSTTKLKALKEFSTLCDSKDEDTVREVSAPWIAQYVNLCKDNEPRIREGTQKALRSYLNRVQRNVAPFLKRFFAHWFVAQYDTHPPTASVASSTFENTFPPNKRVEVIVFCQKEIFNYLIENITNPSLLNTKVDSDEIREMQIRTATSCLYATATFLNSLPAEHIENIESDLKSLLLSNSTYWKLNKHPTPSVRQAWYTLLHSILFKLQQFLEGECKKVAFAVFDNIDEDNVTVSNIIWKSILIVLSKPELNYFWSQSNAEKIFLPKLWKLLSCSKGCISSAYENLLGLCKNSPVMNTITATEFYLKCITSIIQGLEKMSNRFDRTNFVSGIETLFDFVTYILKNNNEDELFSNTVISEVLTLVKFSLTGKLAKTMTPPVISHLAVFLEFLTNNNRLHNLKTAIWNNLNTLLIGSGLDEEIIFDNILSNLQVHLIVLNHLRNPVVKKKKNLRVTFEESGEVFLPSKTLLNDDYQNDLGNFVNVVLQFYLDRTSYPEVGHMYANHVCQVILAFKNYGVDQKLSQTLTGTNDNTSSSFRLYERYVKTWINDDKVLTYNSISVIVGLLETIDNENERISMIDDLNLFGSDVVLKEIMKYISEGNTLPMVICDWLEAIPMQDEFKKFISSDVDLNKSNLLTNCLKLKDNTVCEKWTKVLLETVHTNPTSPLVIMLRQIFEKNLNDQSFVNSHLDLIFNTMECLIRTYLEKSQDGECRDQEELSLTWKLLLNNMIDAHDNEVMKRCSLVVTNYLQTMSVDIEHVENTVDQFIEDFLSCTKQNTLPIKFLYELIKCANSVDHSKAIKCCELALYIKGSLFYTGNVGNYIDTSDECFGTVYALYSHMYVFTKQILKFFNESELPNHLDSVDEEFVNIMADIVCNVNVVAHLQKYFSNRKYCCKIKSTIFEDTKTSVGVLIQSQPKNVAHAIINKIIEKTINEGPYWCKSLEFVLDMLSLPNEELINLYNSAMSKHSDSPNCIHIIQVFVNFCGMSNLEYDHLSLADTRCVWNVHFRKTTNSDTVSQIQKVLDSEEKLLTSDSECLKDEKTMIETIRNIEFLNLIFLYTDDASIILKYSKTIFSRLESVMLTLSNVVDFDCKTYLPIGIATALVGSLFVKLMKFYHEEIYKHVPESNENLIVFRSDTKVVRDCLVKIWVELSKNCNSCIHELVLEALSNSMNYLEFEEIDQKYWFSLCSNLINSDCYPIEITAYNILDRLCGVRKVDVDTDFESDQVPFELSTLPLQKLQDLICTMLTEIKIGSTFEPKTFSEDLKNTRVYLLLWNVIFKLCSKLESQERYKYISHLNNNNSISFLMENLLKLMPHSIIKTYANNDVNPIIKELFNLRPSCSPTDYWNNKKLWHMVCWTYYNLLHTLPAVVRKWWVDSEHKVSTLVDKLTTKYVSQSLIIQEFQDIKQAKKIDNIVVNLYENRGILVVSYMIEETAVDITIQMASNHPLGLIKVSSDKSMINMSQWKGWLKQLALFFSHQNGSIIDGISLWQLNITKKFDGVEECYICYSILHNSNYQLPKSACRTCHKKFHSSCLYKWFVTSNKSTCPICRNLF